MIAIVSQVQAQHPFYVGTYGFSPEWDPAVARTHYVQGALETPDQAQRLRFLSPTQFSMARLLGLNLIHPVVHPDYVDIASPNVIRQIHDEAADPSEPLYMCVSDFGIDHYLAGERIMLHPESPLDFTTTGDYEPDYKYDFDEIPVNDVRLSKALHPATEQPSNNCIRFEMGKGSISGVPEPLKRQLSMYREWQTDDPRMRRAASGLYIVSVIVQLEEALGLNDPNSTTSLMNVIIHTNDSTNYDNPIDITLSLQERHFYDGGQRVFEAIEVVLGYIEMRQTGDNTGTAFIVHRPELPDTAINEAWTNTLLSEYEKAIPNNEFWSEEDYVTRRTSAIDIEIGYGDGVATFYLDAICLSSPRTFAMYYPDHEIFQTGALAVWRDTREKYLERLALCLTDPGSTPPTPLPNVRFITGPESGWRSAIWPLVSAGDKLLQNTFGTDVMLYCAMGYSEDAHVAAAVNRRFALGYYGYPVDISMARPLSLATDPAEYQRAVNRHVGKGFTEIARHFLYFSRQREKLPDIRPWLPYIQNHSNLFATSPPDYHDGDELREPTSAEFRYHCNIALAFGADGAILYSLVSCPHSESLTPWAGDPNGEIDENSGILGFLDENLGPRNTDWNGERKFDSAAAFINGYLMPIGSFMKEEEIKWKRGKIWHLRHHQGVDAGENQWVSQVLSFRMDHPTEIIDSSVQSYVLVSEFEKASSNERYLYVVNGRTHREEGDRHIAILLGAMGGAVTHWQVHNLISKDTWILRAIDTDDSTDVRGRGFTDYFRPGEAALYRIKPTSAFWSDPHGFFIPGNLFISEQATLELEGTTLTFLPGRGVYVEGTLHASNTQFSCEDAEAHWDGIFARNGGSATLTNACTVVGARAGAGPGSTLTLDEGSTFTFSCDTCAVLNALGGIINSAGTIAEVPDSGAYLASWYGAEVTLAGDSAFALSQGNNSIGVLSSCAAVNMTRTRLYDQHTGIASTDMGTVWGWTSWIEPGLNRVRAGTVALEVGGDAVIDFGNGTCKRNSIHVEDIDPGYHIVNSNNSLSLWADSVYWSHGMTQYIWPIPKTTGTGQNSVDDPLQYDPVPFRGGNGQFSKVSGGVGSRDWRAVVRDASARGQNQELRNALSSALNSLTAAPTLVDLGEIALWTKRHAFHDLRDTLYTVLLSRPDMESKLLAADMAAEDSLFTDAAEILDSYSFAGSATLLSRALLRKAAVHPLAYSGGYARGLRALDSARSLTGRDRRLDMFSELYPKLYSGLRHASAVSTPKTQATSLINRAIPPTIELSANYPNPFSTVTSFTFKLPDACEVKLTVHDILGREVAVLKQGLLGRGVHSAVFHAGRARPGMYLYRLQAGVETLTGRMLIMR